MKTMAGKRKLELTWIGKENRPKLEPRILMEDPARSSQGPAPRRCRIKRLSEYIGESYFDYLAALKDLVLIMDESHRYRASAGVRAINELKPILGLELTATPFVESSRESQRQRESSSKTRKNDPSWCLRVLVVGFAGD